MLLAIIVISFLLAAAIAAIVPGRHIVEGAAIAASSVALVCGSLIAYKVGTGSTYMLTSMFSIDALSALVTLIVAVAAFFATLYAVPYFRAETTKKVVGMHRVREYYVLINLFLAAMFMAATASHPVVAWIFLEATTLSTAFLISYYSNRSTIEAAWKYLIINAIGLLLAFLGTLLYLTIIKEGSSALISWQGLVANAHTLNPQIAKIAFAFVTIGYGVKIGFAPMHTWKPDAYSKAPAPLGALLSGALLPVAFAILLRFKLVTDTAIGSSYSNTMFIIFGSLSVLVAAFSMLTVRNYKRLLAYSSVEHAGIMALGFGFGGLGIFAALMHMIYHSLIKPSLFFTTGNILIKYHTARITRVTGLLTIAPLTAIALLVGLFAATGLPPFGMFFTEASILVAGIKTHPLIAVVALAAIAVVFIGFFRQVSSMTLSNSKPSESTRTAAAVAITPGESSKWLLVSPIALLAIALLVSFYLPTCVRTLVNEVASRY